MMHLPHLSADARRLVHPPRLIMVCFVLPEAPLPRSHHPQKTSLCPKLTLSVDHESEPLVEALASAVPYRDTQVPRQRAPSFFDCHFGAISPTLAKAADGLKNSHFASQLSINQKRAGLQQLRRHPVGDSKEPLPALPCFKQIMHAYIIA